jgi:hypothetical protein
LVTVKYSVDDRAFYVLTNRGVAVSKTFSLAKRLEKLQTCPAGGFGDCSLYSGSEKNLNMCGNVTKTVKKPAACHWMLNGYSRICLNANPQETRSVLNREHSPPKGAESSLRTSFTYTNKHFSSNPTDSQHIHNWNLCAFKLQTCGGKVLETMHPQTPPRNCLGYALT